MSNPNPHIPVANAPGSPNVRWGNRVLLVMFGAVGVPVAATMLYVFPPSEYPFYPRCMLKVVAEAAFNYPLYCPGCGATRCVAALVRGNIAQAFAYNPLFILLLPLLSYAAVGTAYQMWTGKRMGGPKMPTWLSYTLIAVLMAYFVARNLPVEPFTFLAPHEIVE